jgi:hypothetical protein
MTDCWWCAGWLTGSSGLLLGLLLGVLLGGCAGTAGYAGPRRPGSEVAVIRADLPVSAGLPVSLRLRQVDAQTLPFTTWRVEVLPGQHELLVDCLTRAPDRTQRFRLPVSVEPGGRHHLVAQMGTPAEGCTGVVLE